jgi:hypothetical protein
LVSRLVHFVKKSAHGDQQGKISRLGKKRIEWRIGDEKRETRRETNSREKRRREERR